MKRFISAVLVLFFLTGLHGEEKNIFRDRQIKFSAELFEQGRYFEAISEAARVQGYDDERDYFIYSSYFMGGQYRTVIYNYRPVSGEGIMSFPSRLLLSRAFFRAGNYSRSFKELGKTAYGSLDDELKPELFRRRTESIIYADEHYRIKQEIAAAYPFLKDDYGFMALRAELEKFCDGGNRSPAAAGIMSALIPGAGQIYSGRIREGLISFAAVCSTLAGGLYCRERGRGGEAKTLFFFSGLFYAGNIYGAVNSSEDYNRRRGRDFIERNRGHYPPYMPQDYFGPWRQKK